MDVFAGFGDFGVGGGVDAADGGFVPVFFGGERDGVSLVGEVGGAWRGWDLLGVVEGVWMFVTNQLRGAV